MDTYQRQYEFELQLFVHSFCQLVVEDATAPSTLGGATQTTDHISTAATGEECSGERGRHQGEVRFLNIGEADEVSSGVPSPLAMTAARPDSGAAQRRTVAQAQHKTSGVLPSFFDGSLSQLSAIGGALATFDGGANGTLSSSALVDDYLKCGGPLFYDAQHARAFLQQSHTLSTREAHSRQTFYQDVLKWWSALHRMTAPLHRRAHVERTDRLRCMHREASFRHEVVEEEELGRAVLRFLVDTVRYGVQSSRAWFMHCEALGSSERQSRQDVVTHEISIRAQMTAAKRLLRFHPPHRCWELLAVAQNLTQEPSWGADQEQTIRSTLREDLSCVGSGVGRPASSSSLRGNNAIPSGADSFRTLPPEVAPALKSHARMLTLLEASTKRSQRIRCSSALLHDRLAKSRAEALANRRIQVASAKDASRQRQLEQQRMREAHFERMREESKIEKLAFERQGFESRHPEVADVYKSLLLSPQDADAVDGNRSCGRRSASASRGSFAPVLGGRPSTAGAAARTTQRPQSEDHSFSGMFAARVDATTSPERPVFAARADATTSPERFDDLRAAYDLLGRVPFLPQHQLTHHHKQLLGESIRLRQKRIGHLSSNPQSMRQRRPSSATPNLSSIQHVAYDDDDHVGGGGGGVFGHASGEMPTGKRRSTTPPLAEPEAALVSHCETLFGLMRQCSYHYAAPAPLLYAVDGSDATQGRNLLGDDVELHLLTPLERILRWNLRSQLAFRNEQYAAAEGHLKNALTALHNAEKDRRRASRRRSRGGLSPTNAAAAQAQAELNASGGSADGLAMEGSAIVSPPTDALAPSPSQQLGGATTTPMDTWSNGFGSLSLQNVKVATYTNKAFLSRALGRYRDALQDLQTVLRVQEQQQQEMDAYVASQQRQGNAAVGGGGGGRRGVQIVSPRDDGENVLVWRHMLEHNYGVQSDTLLNIAALLLQVDNRAESLNYARRAVHMLTRCAAEDIQRIEAAATPAATPTNREPQSARQHPHQGALLRHRQLFVNAVACLHNVAMTQSSDVATNPSEAALRRVGKSSHAAALRLGRTVLGGDHAVVVRVESSSSQIAQLLAQ